MSRSIGPSPERNHPRGGRRSSPSRRTRLLLVGTAGLFAGFLAVLSALSPWWYTTTSSTGTHSTAEFYPGENLYVSGGGGGGFTSYAAHGLAAVGGLYGLVLAGSLVVAFTGWGTAVLSVRRALGRGSEIRSRRATTGLLVVGLGVGILLAVAVPLAQPSLYRSDDPGHSCTSSVSPGPCSSFWGSTTTPATTTVWGAALGWWLGAVAAVLLAIALLLLWSSAPATPARGAPERGSN